MRSRLSFLAALCVLPMAALAQFDDGSGGSGGGKPWDGFKLNPKTRLKPDFHNASVDMIISFYQKASGITIVKDPTLTGQMTLTSAKQVPLSDAFALLSTTLSLRNFDLQKDGNLLVIRAKPKGGSGGRGFTGSWPGGSGTNGIPDMTQIGQPQSDTVLRVYPIQYASASQLARTLNDVFQQTSGNQFPFGMMMGGPGGFGRRGGMNMFGNNQQTALRASADDYSNSVIVNAPSKDQRQVADLIKQLDKVTDQPLRSKVYKLTYADATDLSTVLQNVLTANAPKGRGASNTTNNNNGFGGPFGFFNRNNNNSNSQVVADTRTNSVITTTTEENLQTVDRLVKELDTEQKIETSTFVFNLSNAKADNVANLLYQAFGQRSGAGSSSRTNNSSSRSTSSSSNSSSRRSSSPSSLGGNLQSSDVYAMNRGGAIPVDLADPSSDGGALRTNIGVNEDLSAQFFGFGGQQNQNRQSSSTNKSTARDANGRLVNVSDMTGQVTAIADTNTNSIIIVTSPQNADMIKNILAQLDKIPEQVVIETVIVEATLDASTKLGVEWSQTSSLSRILGDTSATGTGATVFGDKTASPAEEGFRYTVTGSKFNAFINALKSDTKYQILSTPKIFTSNNTEASINISQSVPYLTSTRFDTNNNPTYSYSYLDVGIVLTVQPRITSNGFVTMDITQTANDLQGYTTFNAPIVNQREAETTVSVKDGETIVLGGIIRKSVNSTVKKVPLLGDIPLLGNLFRSSSKTEGKTELMIFLTPRIIHDPAEAQKMRQKEEKRLSPSTRDELEKVRLLGTEVKPQEEKKAPEKSNTNNSGAGNNTNTNTNLRGDL